MLPVVAGADETRRQILLYSLILVPLALAPAFIGLAGMLYACAATLLGAAFLWLAVDVWRIRQGKAADAAARRLFVFSIAYLFLLFAVLLIERVYGWINA